VSHTTEEVAWAWSSSAPPPAPRITPAGHANSIAVGKIVTAECDAYYPATGELIVLRLLRKS
jgi:hypothetical protein